MAWSTTVPNAVDHLVDGLTVALRPILVIDGPVVTATSAKEAVVIGYETERAPAIEQREDPYGLDADDTHEFYTVNGAILVLSTGKGTTRVIRRRAYEIVSRVGAWLAADITLGGVVMQAQLGDIAYTSSQSLGGMLAPLSFGIEIEAFADR